MSTRLDHSKVNRAQQGAQAHRDAELEQSRSKRATRRRTKPRATPVTRWARHPTFGLGEVLATIGKGPDRKYQIDFADEVRMVAAKFVKLLAVTTPAAPEGATEEAARPVVRPAPKNAAEVAAKKAEAFVARLDGDHEPGGLGLAIGQAATQRARRSSPHLSRRP